MSLESYVLSERSLKNQQPRNRRNNEDRESKTSLFSRTSVSTVFVETTTSVKGETVVKVERE